MEGLMNRKMVLLLGILVILPLAVGCASTYIPTETGRGTTYRLSEEICCGPTRVELDHGTSYKLAKYGQILNPEAEKNLEPVTGLEGPTTEIIMDKYRKSFEKEAQRPVYNINIGGFGQ
jgi:hypothetical protein